MIDSQHDNNITLARNIAFGYAIGCFTVFGIVWAIAALDFLWLLLFLSASVGVGAWAYSKYLTQPNENEIIQQLEKDIDELQRGYTEQINALAKENRDLKVKLAEFQRKTNTVPPKVRKAEPAPQPAQPVPAMPRNANAASRIHQAWMLDVGGGANINRTHLMQTQNLTRTEVEEGWDLLHQLGFAQKESVADNAKWIITNTDSHELSEAIQTHITSATAGMVHGY